MKEKKNSTYRVINVGLFWKKQCLVARKNKASGARTSAEHEKHGLSTWDFWLTFLPTYT